MPPDRYGHTTGDGRPQFRAALIDACGPGTSIMPPASTERSTQSARLGSTPSTVVALAGRR